MTISVCVAGCDISKTHIDICVLSNQSGVRPRACRVVNDDLKALAEDLKHQGCQLVVFEASGGYEVRLHEALDKVGIAAARLNPRNARAFARARGLLAKTDQLDAAMLADYAKRMDPELTPLPSRQQSKLRALVHRRSQLVDNRAKEKQNLAKSIDPDVRANIEAMIAILTDQIKVMQDQVQRCIGENAELARQNQILRSMPGIGPVLAMTMIARLPELGQINRRKIAALVGLAPHACDSGAFKGQRHIWGGRADVRQALYMGAISAICRKGHWKQIYDQFKQHGKPSKVALIAVMRRMLTTLNVMLKTDSEYSHQHGC